MVAQIEHVRTRVRKQLAGMGLFFLKSTSKTYHNFIKDRGLSIRKLPLAASNERSTNSTPQKKQKHNKREPVLS
jgi:hypothetical protein